MNKTNTETKPQQDKQVKNKRPNYKKELAKALAENIELKDQLLRSKAEFDNIRKRQERDKETSIEFANAAIITGLLPVLDDFGRSLEYNQTKGNKETLLEGVLLVYKNLQKVLQDKGLKPMDCAGQKFDPELHDALIQIEKPGAEPDTIIEEHVKGYYFKDRVIRHAKVIVAK
ncbi:MAG TPA: nucleotide exchange factor GrpE [bacterium]|nr:nucleotide exchange factor GrpE [bacterium]HPN42568.1 nucleotide exchange factor GrpE [bacterium]